LIIYLFFNLNNIVLIYKKNKNNIIIQLKFNNSNKTCKPSRELDWSLETGYYDLNNNYYLMAGLSSSTWREKQPRGQDDGVFVK
jgi:hypothetical protein